MLQQNSDGGGTIHYAWIIAFTGTLVLLLTTGFGRMSYSVILPSMKSGLSLTYTEAGLIGTANFVGYLFLALIGGFGACLLRPRPVMSYLRFLEKHCGFLHIRNNLWRVCNLLK